MSKVSRERVGCELDQMVRSASPLRAFQLMDDMKLLPLVFPLTATDLDLPLVGASGGEERDRVLLYRFGMVYLKVFLC